MSSLNFPARQWNLLFSHLRHVSKILASAQRHGCTSPRKRGLSHGLVALLIVSILTHGVFGQNAGEDPTGIIQGSVFEDVDGDGVQTPVDIPVCAVPVEIVGPNGVVVVNTDDNGQFEAVLPADQTYEVGLQNPQVEHDVTVPGAETSDLVSLGGRPTVTVREGGLIAVPFPLKKKCPAGALQTTVYEGGENDDFAPGNDEPATPSLDLLDKFNKCLGFVDFDYRDCDRCFGHTFQLKSLARPCFIQGARLEIRMRGNNCGSLTSNDGFALLVNGSIWSTAIKNLNSGVWGTGVTQTFNLDLSSLPGPGATTTSLLGALQGATSFDIYVQDDTSVDYVRLEVDFCCPATIWGHKYNDLNLNGIWDTGEPALANWNIQVTAPNASVTTLTTNPAGYYSFTTALPGVHKVKEVQQPGWVQSSPIGQFCVDTTGNVSHGPLDFGNYEECDESEVTTDLYSFGIADNTDPSNREPTTPSTALLDTHSTLTPSPYDTQGCSVYFLETLNFDVPHGCKVVGARLHLIIDSVCTGPFGSQTDALVLYDGGTGIWGDSLNDLVPSPPWNGGSTNITLDLGNLNPNTAGVTSVLSWMQDGELGIYVTDDTAVDAIRFEVDICCPCQPGTVCVSKFEDLNGNGVRDAGEPGLSGWEFHITGPGGSFQVFTDARGRACIDNVPPGTYTILEIQQNGWTQTSPKTVIGKVDVCNPPGALQEGPIIVEFGNCQRCENPRALSCRAGTQDDFDTTNGVENSTPSASLLNILQNCSAGPLTQFDVIPLNACFGHTIKKCWPKDCKVVAATLTIGLCSHEFSGSNDGIGFVEDGTGVWGQAIANLTTNGSWGNGQCEVLTLDLANLPPNANNVTNILAALQDGDLDIYVQDDTGVDFIQIDVEVCCPSKICGFKWNDENKDGVPDASEPRLSGWTIELHDATGAVIATAVTDANGRYCFEGIDAGKYYVNEVHQPGWTQSHPETGYYPVVITGGQSVGLPFGNYECNDNIRLESCVADQGDPDDDLLSIIEKCSGGATTQIGGNPPVDRCFGHTFSDCWSPECCVVGARLIIGLQASNSFLSFNDGISFYDGTSGVYGNSILNLNGTWGAGQSTTLVLDLANLLPDWLGRTNVLAALQDGDFSIAVQDDTGITSLELEVDLCCPGCTIDQYQMSCNYDPTDPSLAVNMSWAPVPEPGCCDRIIVEGGLPPVSATLLTLPGDASSVSVTCAEIAAAGLPSSGVLCVYCEKDDGTRIEIGCCDYSCQGCQLNPVCETDLAANQVCISWTPPTQDCCFQTTVIEPVSGQVLSTFGPGDGGPYCHPCPNLVALAGSNSGQLCVECEGPTGITRECCDWECGDPCDNQNLDLQCDVQPGVGVGLSWNPDINQDCCETIEIRAVDPINTVVIGSFPAGLFNSTFVECADLVAETGQQSGIICVACIGADGTEKVECCDWSCPCDKLELIRCEIDAADNVVFEWNSLDENCCDILQIDINGNPLPVPASADNIFKMSCKEIFALTGATSGTICVSCIRDGAVVDTVCCEFNCPQCEDVHFDIECVELANGDHGITWFPNGNIDECCDTIQITVDGNVVHSQPGSDPVVSVPLSCQQFGPGGHVACVQCIGTDGTVKAEVCCDFECDDCQQIPLDAKCLDLGGGRWGVTWFGGGDCCDMIQILVDGKIVFSQPGSDPTVSVPLDCADYGPGVHTICVQCVDGDGNVRAEACCEIDCKADGGIAPCDCNIDGQGDLSDAICFLSFLFLGNPAVLPCGDGSPGHPSNIALMDFDGSGALDLNDAISKLIHLFLGGPPHAVWGLDPCVVIPECPITCDNP